MEKYAASAEAKSWMKEVEKEGIARASRWGLKLESAAAEVKKLIKKTLPQKKIILVYGKEKKKGKWVSYAGLLPEGQPVKATVVLFWDGDNTPDSQIGLLTLFKTVPPTIDDKKAAQRKLLVGIKKELIGKIRNEGYIHTAAHEYIEGIEGRGREAGYGFLSLSEAGYERVVHLRSTLPWALDLPKNFPGFSGLLAVYERHTVTDNLHLKRKDGGWLPITPDGAVWFYIGLSFPYLIPLSSL